MRIVSPTIRPAATHIVLCGHPRGGYWAECSGQVFGDIYEATGWDDIACKECIKIAHLRRLDPLKPTAELSDPATLGY